MTSRLDEWLGRIEQRHSSSIELGLERCAAVWARMGRPRPARHLISVAGTNGKGSTVAGIDAAFRFLGRRVGSYTSPHLVRYSERIRIGGDEAGDEAIIDGFEAVEAAAGDTRLTYFEFATLAALATLSRAALDFAVLEIGLGGRLDAVNVLDANVAVITPIGLDHQEYLGNDRDSVGREKAGILRPGQTVVCSDRDPPDSVYSTADRLDARLIRIGADFDISHDRDAHAVPLWRYFFADLEAAMPIAMAGAHQADNLAGALTAVLVSEPEASARLDELAVAVAGSRLRGRLERVSDDPEIIVDVGHNPLAAMVIAEFLDGRDGKPCLVVLGMLHDKDAEGVAKHLGDRVSAWYCGGLLGPRGQTGEDLALRVRAALPQAAVGAYPTVATALDAAIDDAGQGGLVLVFGSFHTAGEAITHAERRNC